MKPALLLLLAAAAFGAAPANDPVLSAMEDELARSAAIKVQGLEAPYYLEYTLEDGRSFSVSASMGGVVSVRNERFRIPAVRVRVGDYRFDNTNYVGSGFAFGSRYDVDRFPLENVYPVLRRYLWLATDTAYKSAIEAISRKRAALKHMADGERLDDFAKAAPTRRVEEIRTPGVG